MNEREVRQLLALAAGFDNRKPDELTAKAWHKVLANVDFEKAQQVVIDHAMDSDQYLNVRHIVDGVLRMDRQLPSQIAEDVRSARAQGLLAPDWPENRPIPVHVRDQVEKSRQMSREAAQRRDDEHEITSGGVDLGVILKSPDDLDD